MKMSFLMIWMEIVFRFQVSIEIILPFKTKGQNWWEIFNSNVAKLEHTKFPNSIDGLDFNTIDKSKIIQKAIIPFWCLIVIHNDM